MYIYVSAHAYTVAYMQCEPELRWQNKWNDSSHEDKKNFALNPRIEYQSVMKTECFSTNESLFINIKKN